MALFMGKTENNWFLCITFVQEFGVLAAPNQALISLRVLCGIVRAWIWHLNPVSFIK